jgi:hypothetical protein
MSQPNHVRANPHHRRAISNPKRRMAKSVDERGPGARLARRDEGDILAYM